MIKVDRSKLEDSISKVPEALQALNTWCCYYNDTEGYLHKKPISVMDKRGGISPDKSDRLVCYDKAVEFLSQGKAAAIGVGLTPDIGIVCIDIDLHNLDLEDKFKEIKAELLSRFKGYAEVSISGAGVHIFIKGKIPEGYKSSDKYGIIEVFDNRFIITTGDTIEGREIEVIEQHEVLQWLCETYLTKSNLKELATVAPGKSAKTDEEIIEKVKNYKKGQHFLNGQYD